MRRFLILSAIVPCLALFAVRAYPWDSWGYETHERLANEAIVGTTTPTDEEIVQIKSLVSANKQSACTQDFWVVYECGAFQGRVDQDYDPDQDGEQAKCGVPSQGYTYPQSDSEAGCLVYRETVRDRASKPDVKITESNFWKALSLHESGHEFGLADAAAHGLIMHYNSVYDADTQAKIDALTFSGAGLQKIMCRQRPGYSD